MAERVAVVGLGVTGQSIVRFLQKDHASDEVVVLDTREPNDDLSRKYKELDIRWATKGLPKEHFDRIVVSPGLSMESCLMKGAIASGAPIFSDIDLFFDAVEAPVIGITGTNGKSTVTSLVGHLLQRSGLNTGVGGNLGEAALDLVAEDRDAYVVELSSFQLERSREQPYDAAVILNVSEDHIDQHGSFEKYKQAKQRILSNAKKTISNRDDPNTGQGHVSFGLSEPVSDSEWGLMIADGRKYIAVGRETIVDLDSLPISGSHNVLNVMAACALVDGMVPRQDMSRLLGDFQGLEHRFETAAVIDDVEFVDDSKATNVGATVAALAGIEAESKVVLIAGGDAKGADLSPLAKAIKGKVKCIITIGLDGDKVASLGHAANIETLKAGSIEEAVSLAAAQATKGDMVLLSPACASLDMFENFKQRGDKFVKAVKGLEAQR